MKEVWQTNPLTTSVTQTPKVHFQLVMLNRGFLVSPSIYFHTVFVDFSLTFDPHYWSSNGNTKESPSVQKMLGDDSKRDAVAHLIIE